jgi:hypothetical protein
MASESGQRPASHGPSGVGHRHDHGRLAVRPCPFPQPGEQFVEKRRAAGALLGQPGDHDEGAVGGHGAPASIQHYASTSDAERLQGAVAVQNERNTRTLHFAAITFP